jgi:hypothetical protein
MTTRKASRSERELVILREAWQQRFEEWARLHWPAHPEIAAILLEATFGATQKDRAAAARQFDAIVNDIADEALAEAGGTS